jgi:hypothetical protein
MPWPKPVPEALHLALCRACGIGDTNGSSAAPSLLQQSTAVVQRSAEACRLACCSLLGLSLSSSPGSAGSLAGPHRLLLLAGWAFVDVPCWLQMFCNTVLLPRGSAQYIWLDREWQQDARVYQLTAAGAWLILQVVIWTGCTGSHTHHCSGPSCASEVHPGLCSIMAEAMCQCGMLSAAMPRLVIQRMGVHVLHAGTGAAGIGRNQPHPAQQPSISLNTSPVLLVLAAPPDTSDVLAKYLPVRWKLMDAATWCVHPPEAKIDGIHVLQVHKPGGITGR